MVCNNTGGKRSALPIRGIAKAAVITMIAMSNDIPRRVLCAVGCNAFQGFQHSRVAETPKFEIGAPRTESLPHRFFGSRASRGTDQNEIFLVRISCVMIVHCPTNLPKSSKPPLIIRVITDQYLKWSVPVQELPELFLGIPIVLMLDQD